MHRHALAILLVVTPASFATAQPSAKPDAARLAAATALQEVMGGGMQVGRTLDAMHGSIVTILEQITDVVLSVAWCVKRCNLDTVANLERLSVARGLRHLCTVFATDDRNLKAFELDAISLYVRFWVMETIPAQRCLQHDRDDCSEHQRVLTRLSVT